MPFETPITIREAISRIQAREYLLPGIQREFVWKQDQICRLFDSLLRGYPFGSFLFWSVTEEHKGDYQFYEFVRNYHERDARHNAKASLAPGGGLTAVLDGQQRLTSLYIGLLGTYTERRKYARRESASSYAKRRLYLNLGRLAESQDGSFDFSFREDENDFVQAGDDFWFRVGFILNFKQTTDVFDFLIEHGLTQSKFPKTCLVELHQKVTQLPLINYFTEVDQGLDHVLNIFIRVNSGGTTLSYSDLLLSIASAQWEERDAREVIHDLVDEINRDYGEFDFPRDFVLKSCLMVADVDLRWKVANFNRPNMLKIEALWPKIEEAIRLAVKIVSGFGFTGKTLASANAVIPIVYYLFRRGNPKGFDVAVTYQSDRATIQRWLNIVLLKQTFGGVPDNVLRRMREVIKNTDGAFPADAIAVDLAATPNALSFRKEELDALLELRYGGPYTFPLLAMLYPTLDYRHKLHQDHIHPRSHFSLAQLKKRGIPEELHQQYLNAVDQVPNLQLLEGQPNIEKAAVPFVQWMDEIFAEFPQRNDYKKRNFIPEAEANFGNFIDFFAKRRALLRSELHRLVGFQEPEVENEPMPEEEGEEIEVVRLACANRASQALQVELVRENRTCFLDNQGETRAVCIVSKKYVRGPLDRYWYAVRPSQVEFLQGSGHSYVIFGCGSSDLTAMIPAEEFLPTLDGMRQTEEDGGRSYWHVELFGNHQNMELGQSLLNRRVNVTAHILPVGANPIHG